MVRRRVASEKLRLTVWVCANVFGLRRSVKLRAMMEFPGVIVTEQTPLSDISPHHLNRTMAGLIHDRSFRDPSNQGTCGMTRRKGANRSDSPNRVLSLRCSNELLDLKWERRNRPLVFDWPRGPHIASPHHFLVSRIWQHASQSTTSASSLSDLAANSSAVQAPNS